MKYVIAFFLVICCATINAQQKKNGIVKTNGDTVWCDEVVIKFNGKNQVRVAECTGGSVSEVQGSEVAFIIYSNRIEIVSASGYMFGRVLIWGLNNYMTTGMTDDHVQIFHILDKNRKWVKKMKIGKAIFPEIKEHFGDCDEFKAEVDKAEASFNQKTYRNDVIALAAKYACKAG